MSYNQGFGASVASGYNKVAYHLSKTVRPTCDFFPCRVKASRHLVVPRRCFRIGDLSKQGMTAELAANLLLYLHGIVI